MNQPHLKPVESFEPPVIEPSDFDTALARLAHLRTSLMLVASPDAAKTELRLTFVNDRPAIEAVITMKALGDPARTTFVLRSAGLKLYAIDKITTRRDPAQPGSVGRWQVVALITPKVL